MTFFLSSSFYRGKKGQGRKGKWRGKAGKFEREKVEN